MSSFSAPHSIHSAPRHCVDWHRKSITYTQGEAISLHAHALSEERRTGNL